ncbi:GHKL domain-containing protein [Tissierella sp. MB52-C2]|uniref:sensor histidine kinase n=1 Tax=Tissierella sp. MB52-C2 TaxID=3070999 RepID=UPI00280B4851|nr:GHKL domain-containing protein [Tissierella sp. MB52-C2]WMM25781.1 GHKL domain-containing protein [Tissierella sp. MB52-C2]
MNGLRLLIDIIGLFFEISIISYYMGTVLKECKVNKRIELSSYFIMMISITITTIYYQNTTILPMTYFIMLMLISMLYKGEILLKVILNLILVAFFIASEVIAVTILVVLIGENAQFILNNILHYSQVIFISKVLVFIIIKIYEYRSGNTYSFIRRRILFPLISIPISSILVICIIAKIPFVTTSTYITLSVILTTSLLIVANIFIFYLFEKQLKQEQKNIKLEFFKQQFKKQKKHFEELTENQRRINKTMHDTKNQLLAILGYIENNENDIAIENLNLLCNNIVERQKSINTGNIAVDSLLNVKINKIKELDIDLEISIFLEQNNQIEEIELCIILGNLLDNSIEACEKIPLDGEKKIKLKIIQVEEYLSIYIRNSTCDKIKFEKSKISTTKKDKIFHGFGLENIKEIVDKYNGHMDCEYIEDTFIVKVLLQNSLTSAIS